MTTLRAAAAIAATVATAPRRLDRWLGRSVPPDRMVALRIATGVYSLVLISSLAKGMWKQSQLPHYLFAPVGVGKLLNGPLSPLALGSLFALTFCLAMAFIRGRWPRATAPAFAASLLILLTYRSCWGMVFHTENLLVLQVGLLALVPLLPSRSQGSLLNCLQLATVATYCIAGWAKLQNTGWHWTNGEVLRQQLAYDTLRKSSLGAIHSPVALWVLPHATLFAPAAALALGTELLAPLALVGRKFAYIWCTCAWLFHLGVLLTMAIAFSYPLSGCAFLCFLHPETNALIRCLVRKTRS